MLSRLLFVASTAALFTFSVGCQEPRGLLWTIDSESGVRDDAVRRVIARIHRGSCSGAEILYEDEAGPNAGAVPVLPPGRYGFEAVALDDTCTPIAATCVDVMLPLTEGETLTLVLRPDGGPPECPASMCVDGVCGEGPVDGGAMDAGTMDGGPDAALDAAGDSALDSAARDAAPDVVYTYEWIVESGCGACSVNCGGGSCPKTVYCRRDDGMTVADGECTGTKPATLASCNNQACCATNALSNSDSRCTGTTSDIISWDFDHYGDDTGSAANRAMCQAQCTAWAGTRSAWCCDLTEDSSTGTSWACAAHTGTTIGPRSGANIRGSYAGLGGCTTP